MRIIVAIGWLAIFALIVVAVARASRGQPTRNLGILIVVLLISNILLTGVSAGLVFVQPQDRAVVISALAPKGYREQALQPGLNWIVPFLETVEQYPISRQTYTMSIAHTEGAVLGDDSIAARTADGQEVLIDASVIFAIDPNQVVGVHIDWQDRYTDELVRPLARGIIRDAISQFGVEEVYSSKRTELSTMINDAMSKKLAENGLILEDFLLRNITFSPEYAASVEQKQIAEQMAQQAKFVVEQRKQEAEQARQMAQGQADSSVIRAQGDANSRLIQAEAEAKALQTISAAVKDNPDLLNYLYILKINPTIQTMLLQGEVPLLFNMPTPLGPPAPTSSTIDSFLLPTPTPVPTPTATP
jgi:regulator of protease activity HflC (stomatin/prohibitin superfamily)